MDHSENLAPFSEVFGIYHYQEMDDHVKEKVKLVLEVLLNSSTQIKDDTCLNKLIDLLRTKCMIYIVSKKDQLKFTVCCLQPSLLFHLAV